MAISDALHTAHENLLRVIPRPLTAEEEAERVRTGRGRPDVDPTALQEATRRFVDAISREPAAEAELKRRGTLVTKLTGDGSEYLIAKKNAQKTLANWKLSEVFAESPVRLQLLQKVVSHLLQSKGDCELVAEVRNENERLCQLLEGCPVPDATRPLLEAWCDTARPIISAGENDSLDGCYQLLQTENLRHAFFVGAPDIRQAADALVRWQEEQSRPRGATTDDSVWVLISKLQPPRIPNVKERQRYVVKHGDEIRSRRALTKAGAPHPKRLEVHIGDWVKHWDKIDAQTFDSLDAANPTPVTSDELTDDFIDGATKLYSKVFEGKRPRP